MPDGTYVIIYDTSEGVKMAFSTTSGRTWNGCDVVVSREGRGCILLDNYLLYVTAEGIEAKYSDFQDIYQLRSIAEQKKAGVDVSSLEEEMQSRFDRMEQDLIGSGIISFQRISGYVTPEGIIKVFYYGDNNELISMQTKNNRVWTVSDNF
jgi:hypothetical protein